MLGGQEHELTMRTAELIEDNAQQALELLVRYATSSRAYTLFLVLLIANSYKPRLPGIHSFSTV
jgi:hypothetical protein